MMINCKKSSMLVSKKIDRELTFFEKLSLKLHLFICGGCKSFEVDVNVISDVIHCSEKNTPELSEEKKIEMQNALNAINN